MNQNEQLFNLLKQYPQAKIYPFTHCDVVCDDYGYWSGKIKKVYYGKFWINDETIFFSEHDAKEYQEDHGYHMQEIEGIIIKIESE